LCPCQVRSMVRTVESGSQARAPHGHGIREHNPAAGDATLSVACLPASRMTPCRAGTACWRCKDSPTGPWVFAIAPGVTHGRLACLGSLTLAQN
jgi:hypothetical protein